MRARVAEKVIPWLAAFAYLVCLGHRIVMAINPASYHSFLFIFQYFLIWNFDFIPLGVMLSYVFRKYRTPFGLRERKSLLLLSPFLIFLPLILAALSEGMICSLYERPMLAGLIFPFTGLCFVVLLWSAATDSAFPRTRGRFYRFLLYLGDRSYSYYLMQFPVFMLVWLFVSYVLPVAFSSPWIYGLVQAVLSAGLLYLIVEIVYRKVEVPMQRIGRKVAAKIR